jgi:hypothetical protein
MTNEKVVNAFLKRLEEYSLNMTSTGEKLYSYSTVVAQWIDGEVVFNATKYSRTTSKQTSILRYDKSLKQTTQYVPFNTSDLRQYL